MGKKHRCWEKWGWGCDRQVEALRREEAVWSVCDQEVVWLVWSVFCQSISQRDIFLSINYRGGDSTNLIFHYALMRAGWINGWQRQQRKDGKGLKGHSNKYKLKRWFNNSFPTWCSQHDWLTIRMNEWITKWNVFFSTILLILDTVSLYCVLPIPQTVYSSTVCYGRLFLRS